MRTSLINLAERVIERLAQFGQDATLLPTGDADAVHLRFEIAGVPVRYSIWPAAGWSELHAERAVSDGVRPGLDRRMRTIAERMWLVPSTRRALAAASTEVRP
jgi:hypothetical protein